MNVSEMIDSVFPKGTAENDLIVECYEVLLSGVPTVMSEAKNQMYILDNMRVKLVSLYYMVSQKLSAERKSVQGLHDAQYTRLVKLGRPSNTAIESELRATNTEYATKSFEFEKLEQIKELINSYIKCIDESKRSAIESLRVSARID